MKTLLICPSPRSSISRLASEAPIAALPILGESLVEYWLTYLAERGAREITVLAADRPGAVLERVGDGARWGLKVEVLAELRELSPSEARAAHGGSGSWMAAPLDVIVMDHFPDQPRQCLLESYESWFKGVTGWITRAVTPDRVGVREIRPGVFVGWHSRIPADAVLIAPCWIGEKVFLGSGVTVGPHAVIEDRAVIERGAEVVRSVVGPETLVGEMTEVGDSLAWGDTLINWQTGSMLRVPDEFLLCPLRAPARAREESGDWLTRLTRPWTGPAAPVLSGERAMLSPPGGMPRG